MKAVWSEQHRYDVWLEVELLALQAMETEGLVPAGVSAKVRAGAKVDAERIQEIEREVKHDVIAFLTNISESAGAQARFVHRGMTSNDLLDTSFAVLLREASSILMDDIDALLSVMHRKALEYAHTITIGRSHGIHAEPTSFGVKIAGWFAELQRRRADLIAAIEAISVGKIAGAVGTYASLPPQVEERVLQALDLRRETVPTQIVSRDRHAEFFVSLALLASSIERWCVEIRHLQRTEVSEVEEPFSKGQKGSSAMPHKKNPILCENLTGLARLVRGYAQSALENVALWHERDISHSSVERVIAPDACILIDFMLARFLSVIDGLVVHEKKMQENVELSGGLIFSGTVLVRLADSGMSREDAYSLVQSHALAATGDPSQSFEARVRSDDRVSSRLSENELNEVFGLERHLAHVDEILERTFADWKEKAR